MRRIVISISMNIREYRIQNTEYRIQNASRAEL
jgi:hypothetical protein